MKCRLRKPFAALLAAAALLAMSSAHADYVLNDLGAHVTPKAINNAGTILGFDGSGSVGVTKLWNGASSSVVPTGAYGGPVALNDAGTMVGSQSTYYTTHAMVWSGQSSQDLGTLPSNIDSSALNANESFAVGINNAGQIVGTSGVDSPDSQEFATVWSNGQVKNLGALDPAFGSHAFGINDVGQIVGASYVHGVPTATFWQADTMTAMGNNAGASSAALAINRAGQSVGWTGIGPGFTSKTVQHATLWNGLTPQDLGTLGGLNSRAVAINDTGMVVGSSQIDPFSGRTHATLWENGQVIDLNSFLTASELAEGWVLTSATGINDDGSIIGEAMAGPALGTSHGFVLSVAVPELGTLPMTVLALGGLLFVRRQRSGQRQVDR